MSRKEHDFEIECHDGRIHRRSLWVENFESGFRILKSEAFPFGWKQVRGIFHVFVEVRLQPKLTEGEEAA